MDSLQPSQVSPFSRSFKHQQKLAAILSEAASLFNHRGTRGTTLGDIAQGLGINKTSLYYYVRTKDELIYRCYLESCGKIEAIIRHANQGNLSGRERLQLFVNAWFDAYRQIALGNSPHYAILWEIPALAEDHRKDIAERYSQLFKKVRRIITDGNGDGSLVASDPTASALAFFGLTQQAMLWLSELSPADGAAAAGVFADLMLEGLATEDLAPIQAPPPRGRHSSGFDRDAQRLQKQRAFIRAGCAIFNQKGFRGTSLDEIAESLEVTKGAFYYHIKDKEQLLFDCFEHTFQRIGELQHLALEQQISGLDQIAHCLHHIFHSQYGEAGPLIRYNLLISLPRERRRQLVSKLKIIRQRFAGMLKQGFADGSVRTTDLFVTERVISGAINTCIELPMVRPVKDPAAAAGDFFQVILHGLSSSARGRDRQSGLTTNR